MNELGSCDVCGDDLFPHLTNEAVREYLYFLVDYLDDFDTTCGVLPDEEWRVMLGMEQSGI